VTVKELIEYLQSEVRNGLSPHTTVVIYDVHGVESDVLELFPEHLTIEEDDSGEELLVISSQDDPE
jgi:hypothetical protein